MHRFQTQMLNRGDHNRDRAHPLFFGQSSAYSGGLANYAIRTESLRAGATPRYFTPLGRGGAAVAACANQKVLDG